jgi:hypothetical protein
LIAENEMNEDATNFNLINHDRKEKTGNIYAHCTQKMEKETVDILEKVLEPAIYK